jgi:GNAT superfamily N-acetyltransferase
MNPIEVVRSDSARARELEAEGGRLVAESWGARLRIDAGTTAMLETAITRADVELRELGPEYAVAVLELETATNDDYPVTPATPHPVRDLPWVTALWRESRLFGALDGGRLVAVAALTIEDAHGEVDFASVLADYRGQGVGAAVVAFAILAAVRDGARGFRTGGAAVNTASLQTARALGFTIDERWLSYER